MKLHVCLLCALCQHCAVCVSVTITQPLHYYYTGYTG